MATETAPADAPPAPPLEVAPQAAQRDPAVFTRPGASGLSPRALFDAIWELANGAVPGAITQAQADLRYLQLATGGTLGGPLVVTGNLTPEATATRDLGLTGSRWRTLYVQDINTTAATAGTATAGTSGAPPAQVSGYLTVTIGGTARKVPYYNT